MKMGGASARTVASDPAAKAALAPVRWSNLHHLARSPKYYRHVLDNGLAETPAMRIGSIVHGHVLGSQHSFVVYEDDRKGNAWKEFKAAHEGRRIITRKEHDQGYEIAQAILRHPDARTLVRGTKERRIEWTMNGRACHGTPDFVRDGAALTDLKITADARPEKFIWQAQRMQWFGQLDWYRNGLKLGGYGEPRDLFIIGAEPKAPYDLVVYELTPAAVELGMRTWRLLWERLMVCEDSNEWPGYVQGVMPLDVPADGEDLSLVIDGEEVDL